MIITIDRQTHSDELYSRATGKYRYDFYGSISMPIRSHYGSKEGVFILQIQNIVKDGVMRIISEEAAMNIQLEF